MNDSKVKVTANKQGHVISIAKNNSVYGHIRVVQRRILFDEKNGFAQERLISALIPGTVKTLRGFGWRDQQEVEGKIRIVEQMHPFNKKEPDRDIKIAGKSGVVCSVKGEPIYRKNFYTTNMNLEDVFKEHDNEDEISMAYDEVEIDGNAVDNAEEPEIDGNSTHTIAKFDDL